VGLARRTNGACAEQRDRDGLQMDAIACGGVGRTEMEGKIEGLRVIWATYVCVYAVCACVCMTPLPAVNRGTNGRGCSSGGSGVDDPVITVE